MALKSTVFKAELAVADIDRGYYADHASRWHGHPSETDEANDGPRARASRCTRMTRSSRARGLSTED